MTRSPAGRRAPRAGGPGPDEWLEVPGWRRPVDTLLVLAVTFATAWVGLVVIPAAAHSDSTQVQNPTTHTENDASPPTAGPSRDPSQWFAGPVYTGEPPAVPTVEQVAAEAPVVVAAPRTAAHRTTPRRTTTHAAPRTTAKAPAATTTVAPVVAAAVTTPAVTTAETTTPPTVTTPPTTTTSDTTTSSSTTTETTTPPTSPTVPPG
jgi:hypothetical protein